MEKFSQEIKEETFMLSDLKFLDEKLEKKIMERSEKRYIR